MTDTPFNAYRFGPMAAGKPQQIVVLLHGVGSDGQDLISLAPYFAKHLPNALFVSPDAPFRCDMAPMGYQWFSLAEWTEDAMLKGVKEVAPLVDNFVDKLLKSTGLTDDKLAFIGFSQGTMTSLYVAPRRANACAGVLGYSGALLGAKELSSPSIHKIPTCLIHGQVDDVVPVSAWHQAMDEFKKADFPIEGTTIPRLAHGIDEKCIEHGITFLKKIFLG